MPMPVMSQQTRLLRQFLRARQGYVARTALHLDTANDSFFHFATPLQVSLRFSA